MGDILPVGRGSVPPCPTSGLAEGEGGRAQVPGTQKVVANHAHCDKQGRSRGLEKGVCREPEDMVSFDSA